MYNIFLWRVLQVGKLCQYRCCGLLLLETYTTKVGEALKLPDFLEFEKEVTNDSEYSMFQLSYSEN